MYKTPDKSQPSLLGFNQPFGLRMNPDNRWVQLAARVPWEVFEKKYAALFPSGTGNVAKPLRLALGSLTRPMNTCSNTRMTADPCRQHLAARAGTRRRKNKATGG